MPRLWKNVHVIHDEGVNMTRDTEVFQKWVKCSNGHSIRLDVKKGTPNLIQTIQCPVCHTMSVTITGELVRSQIDDGTQPG
jgi:hypothetical protein